MRVATFLFADERDRGLGSRIRVLRLSASRYLHQAVGLPLPYANAAELETTATIRLDALNPITKRAAPLTVLRELFCPMSDDLRDYRGRKSGHVAWAWSGPGRGAPAARGTATIEHAHDRLAFFDGVSV